MGQFSFLHNFLISIYLIKRGECMKALIFIIMILNVSALSSSEAFNNYVFDYKGKSYKMSQFISDLRKTMPNKDIKARFDKHIEPIIYYSLKRDLDPVLVLSMIVVESGLSNKARSGVGAKGLMQIMPGTKKDIMARILSKPKFAHMAPNKKVIDFDLDSPNENIELGTIYVVYLMEKFKGNIQKVVIAYNEGPGYFATLPKGFKHNHRHYNRVNNVYGKINKRLLGNDNAERSPASLQMAKM